VTVASHGKKLIVLGQDKDWFWVRVNASDLVPLLQTGYENINYGFITALSER
jgi:hypothetical protein